MIAANEDSSRTGTSAGSHRPGIGALLTDLISLGELQGRLFLHDLSELTAGSAFPLVALLVGMVLAFATVPILLLGLALLITEVAMLPVWAAMFLSAAAFGMLPAGVMFLISLKVLRQRSAVMQRSTAELSENVRWLKHRMKSAF